MSTATLKLVLFFPEHVLLHLLCQTELVATLQPEKNMIFENSTKKQRPLEPPFLSHVTCLFTVGATARSFCVNTEKHRGAPSRWQTRRRARQIEQPPGHMSQTDTYWQYKSPFSRLKNTTNNWLCYQSNLWVYPLPEHCSIKCCVKQKSTSKIFVFAILSILHFCIWKCSVMYFWHRSWALVRTSNTANRPLHHICTKADHQSVLQNYVYWWCHNTYEIHVCDSLWHCACIEDLTEIFLRGRFR